MVFLNVENRLVFFEVNINVTSDLFIYLFLALALYLIIKYVLYGVLLLCNLR
jgi:hypothetical protein